MQATTLMTIKRVLTSFRFAVHLTLSLSLVVFVAIQQQQQQQRRKEFFSRNEK
jgi:hypothetical protein